MAGKHKTSINIDPVAWNKRLLFVLDKTGSMKKSKSGIRKGTNILHGLYKGFR